MSANTRRRVIVCVVAVALALGVETILLNALSAPSQSETARRWAAQLSTSELDQSVDRIQSYPFRYRKAIMRELSPERRARVWRRHIAAYAETHSGLPSDALPVIAAILEQVTPEALSNPTPSSQASIVALAEQVKTLIGQDEAEYLLYRLGPKDGTFASIEPFSHKLAGRVRGWLVAMAFTPEICDCIESWGCDGMTTHCEEGGCLADDDWPMCGWLWNTVCNGLCKGGRVD